MLPMPDGSLARRVADGGLAILVLGVVGMMILPLPTALLDLLIAGNITLGVLLLMVAIHVRGGLELTSFPTLLLITTLYRLALNVSSTRLILLQADAGEVIAAFGDFVVRGNYVVGGVVFLILTLIQFLVIAKGSERVAEVGARFTLDAMPGKQMSIDAELRSGALSQDEAREKRRGLERESQFYGAMDGAMKFVKGDAIASLVITAINLVGGLIVGVGMRDLSFGESLRLYGLLTIGDGLVSQIPSLLISTSAGLVVTRVAAEDPSSSLGGEIATQVFGNPKALRLGAFFLLTLSLVPGMPTLPFLGLACSLGALAWRLGLQPQADDAPTSASGKGREELAGADARVPLVLPLGVEVGVALAPALGDGGPRSPLLEVELPRIVDRLFLELGLPVPAARLRVSPELGARQAVISVGEVPVVRLEVPSEAEDPRGLVADGLERAVRARARDLIGLDDVQAMLDKLELAYPAAVRAVVPKPLSLALLTDILRRLVEEGVSIRPLREILEALAIFAPNERCPVTLTELVRAALRHQISHRHAQDGVLGALMLDPELEEAVREAIQHTSAGSYLALEPQLAKDMIEAIRRSLEGAPGFAPLLLTQSDVRRFVRRLVETELPELSVLSYQELAPAVSVRPLGHVNL